jgi:hypothetical protein
VAQKVIDAAGDWDLAKALLESYEFGVEAVVAEDGEWAARRWRRGEGLSLGDRLCLALGERLDQDATAYDKGHIEGPSPLHLTSWTSRAKVVQITERPMQGSTLAPCGTRNSPNGSLSTLGR